MVLKERFAMTVSLLVSILAVVIATTTAEIVPALAALYFLMLANYWDRQAKCAKQDAEWFVTRDQELVDEKGRRAYYQGIVYEVCRSLDAMLGRSRASGTEVVCGTVDCPRRGVHDAMQEAAQKLRTLSDEATRLEDAVQEAKKEAARWRNVASSMQDILDSKTRPIEEVMRSLACTYVPAPPSNEGAADVCRKDEHGNREV